ncbi:MAG: hypothetical protein K2O70_09585, partial [Desulfovibrionaceae bacterium]|nr:hypothetical protein [Desulfovibrionaceae bacterium]
MQRAERDTLFKKRVLSSPHRAVSHLGAALRKHRHRRGVVATFFGNIVEGISVADSAAFGLAPN